MPAEPRSAYALVRPPGHHATRRAFGGSCYLNNAAVAAQALRDRGAERVAVVDIDAHHGNGTQAIFYDRADVFYGSLHVDPGAGWFPHFVGLRATSAARARGAGATANVRCRPAPATRAGWPRSASCSRAASGHGPDALVVSLGVDAAGVDPESPLEVSTEGFRRRRGAARRAAAGPPCSCTRAATSWPGSGVDTVAVLESRSGRAARAGGTGTIQDLGAD